MSWLDAIILAAAGFAAMVGLGIGGIHVAVTGVAVLLGTSLAGHYHDLVEPLVSRFTDAENQAQIISFAVIMVVVILVAVAVGVAVRAFLKGLKLGWVDRLLGSVLAVVIALAVGSALLSVVQTYPVGGADGVIDDSVLGTFLADNFDTVLRAIRFIPKDLGV